MKYVSLRTPTNNSLDIQLVGYPDSLDVQSAAYRNERDGAQTAMMNGDDLMLFFHVKNMMLILHGKTASVIPDDLLKTDAITRSGRK